ncbi:MAG: hypothetical protein KF784_10240 [Fimbriimonadaceae bacterium]|nr:hypothetical protein [Fimbriimonadaceae bacterium]
MSLGLALVTLATCCVDAPQQPVIASTGPSRELIAWEPVAGQQLEYWTRFGTWNGDRFTEWQATTRLMVLSVKQDELFVQTRFRTLSEAVKAGDWRTRWDVDRMPVTTQKLNNYGEPMDAEGALPLNRFWVSEAVSGCGIQYPRNVVGLNESWTVVKKGVSALTFTYVGKEQVRKRDCFKVSFTRTDASDNPQVKCSGTYWLDSSDGKVVRVQIGTREEACGKVSAGPGHSAFYLELELTQAKTPLNSH